MHIRRPVVALFVSGLLMFAGLAEASSTFRVGNQVLTAGDSRERVTALLGKPSSKTHRKHASTSRGRRRGGTRVVDNSAGGEQWRYRHDGHVTVVTIVDGRVTDIEDNRL